MKLNRTVERTIEIMELLSKEKKGLTIKEISKIMDMPKTSTYDILETLAYKEILEKNVGEQNTYKIGIKSFQIGSSYLNTKELFQIINEPLTKLAEKTQKTAFYAVENNGEVVYLAKKTSPKAIITTSEVGSRNPLYCTSLGKAILAFTSEEKRKILVEKQSFEKKTPYTLDKDTLLAELELIRERGYAIDNREVEKHMLCIGAPIYSFENNLIGAISISGLYSKERNIQEEADELLNVSVEISKKLGNLRI